MFISPASSPQLRSTLHLLIHPLTGTHHPPPLATNFTPPRSSPHGQLTNTRSWDVGNEVFEKKDEPDKQCFGCCMTRYPQFWFVTLWCRRGRHHYFWLQQSSWYPGQPRENMRTDQNRILEDMYNVILCISFTWHNSVWIWFWGWTNIWGYRHQSLYLVERTVTFIFW